MTHTGRTEAAPRRLRSLLLRLGIVFVCCSLLLCGCVEKAPAPPSQRLYNVCIAEGETALRILVQVEGIFPRSKYASPPYTHRPLAMYAFAVDLDGNVIAVQFPAEDELSLNGHTVFAHDTDLYVFGEKHMTGGRTLYRITPAEFHLLGNEERDEMLLELQVNDASPATTVDRLEQSSEDSGWKITRADHGGASVADLHYVSEKFQVRLSTETNSHGDELKLAHTGSDESESLVTVARNAIDGGSLRTP